MSADEKLIGYGGLVTAVAAGAVCLVLGVSVAASIGATAAVLLALLLTWIAGAL